MNGNTRIHNQIGDAVEINIVLRYPTKVFQLLLIISSVQILLDLKICFFAVCIAIHEDVILINIILVKPHLKTVGLALRSRESLGRARPPCRQTTILYLHIRHRQFPACGGILPVASLKLVVTFHLIILDIHLSRHLAIGLILLKALTVEVVEIRILGISLERMAHHQNRCRTLRIGIIHIPSNAGIIINRLITIHQFESDLAIQLTLVIVNLTLCCHRGGTEKEE